MDRISLTGLMAALSLSIGIVLPSAAEEEKERRERSCAPVSSSECRCGSSTTTEDHRAPPRPSLLMLVNWHGLDVTLHQTDTTPSDSRSLPT